MTKGNDNIHAITSQSSTYTLQVDIETWDGVKLWASFQQFSISSESDSFRLKINGWTGNAMKEFIHHNGTKWSTIDRDNDNDDKVHCARYRLGPWWYTSCLHVNLNNVYFYNGHCVASECFDCISVFEDTCISIRSTTMKVKRHNN